MPSLSAAREPKLESELVDQFITRLNLDHAPWILTCYIQEFEYGRGRTDIVASTKDGHLIAFEAKLARWRDALHQAYRNKAFAHTSYVVMPYATAHRAAAYETEYEKYGVGLCTIENNKIVILITAREDVPVLGWLAEKAQTQLAGENDRSRRCRKRDMRLAWGLAD